MIGDLWYETYQQGQHFNITMCPSAVKYVKDLVKLVDQENGPLEAIRAQAQSTIIDKLIEEGPTYTGPPIGTRES